MGAGFDITGPRTRKKSKTTYRNLGSGYSLNVFSLLGGAFVVVESNLDE
jgi:hypothetical protein